VHLGGEPLANPNPRYGLYGKITANGTNANEKVFFRMWYEPEYLDKVLEGVIEPRTVISETQGMFRTSLRD